MTRVVLRSESWRLLGWRRGSLAFVRSEKDCGAKEILKIATSTETATAEGHEIALWRYSWNTRKHRESLDVCRSDMEKPILSDEEERSARHWPKQAILACPFCWGMNKGDKFKETLPRQSLKHLNHNHTPTQTQLQFSVEILFSSEGGEQLPLMSWTGNFLRLQLLKSNDPNFVKYFD